MTNDYFILNDGEQSGPFTFDELISGGLEIHTRVMSPEANGWQDACDLPEFYAYFESKGIYFPTGDNLSSFWWRLLAYAIDSVLLFVVMVLVLSQFASFVQKINLKSDADLMKFELALYAVVILYNSICESTVMKGSVGKKICKLVVVDADGVGLSFFNALSRNMGKILSSMAFGLGYINIFWSEHRQAWHDYLAKTYVVKLD